jgi:hypothetical protein
MIPRFHRFVSTEENLRLVEKSSFVSSTSAASVANKIQGKSIFSIKDGILSNTDTRYKYRYKYRYKCANNITMELQLEVAALAVAYYNLSASCSILLISITTDSWALFGLGARMVRQFAQARSWRLFGALMALSNNSGPLVVPWSTMGSRSLDSVQRVAQQSAVTSSAKASKTKAGEGGGEEGVELGIDPVSGT